MARTVFIIAACGFACMIEGLHMTTEPSHLSPDEQTLATFLLALTKPAAGLRLTELIPNARARAGIVAIVDEFGVQMDEVEEMLKEEYLEQIEGFLEVIEAAEKDPELEKIIFSRTEPEVLKVLEAAEDRTKLELLTDAILVHGNAVMNAGHSFYEDEMIDLEKLEKIKKEEWLVDEAEKMNETQKEVLKELLTEEMKEYDQIEAADIEEFVDSF